MGKSERGEIIGEGIAGSCCQRWLGKTADGVDRGQPKLRCIIEENSDNDLMIEVNLGTPQRNAGVPDQ